jgi:hypothetical protein
MTEPLTPRQLRAVLAEKLAGMPTGTDHDGHSDVDRFADSRRFARFAEAETPAVEAPPAQGMKPNMAQGHSSATVPAPPPADPLAAIRAQASKLVR